MFCQNCGKEITNNTNACPYCGTRMMQPAVNNQTYAPVDTFAAGYNTPQYAPNNIAGSVGYYAPSPEAISFTEHPSREQTTINMHQQMGWTLKSSQEINTSTTHVYGNTYAGTGHTYSFIEKQHYVKLTFERDRNHPNYPILKQNYDQFTSLAAKILELEASVDKRKPLFYVLCCIPAALALLIAFSTIGLFGFAILPLALALVVPVMLMANMIATKIEKKKIKPEVEQLYAQMQMIASETEPYVTGAASLPHSVPMWNQQFANAG
ncbi:zinc ribbon domain-containing protein [uncultured Ruminococcus sp.]|uniref:zinc ribbon domain-containing protein n=1 Tax=uncultured Ruminococcus sp. TaxID=165186 RepID=UPI002930ACE3|nr:zinc ribbon domain-containing protein [uncultured Ruminococcus sp.]